MGTTRQSTLKSAATWFLHEQKRIKTYTVQNSPVVLRISKHYQTTTSQKHFFHQFLLHQFHLNPFLHLAVPQFMYGSRISRIYEITKQLPTAVTQHTTKFDLQKKKGKKIDLPDSLSTHIKPGHLLLMDSGNSNTQVQKAADGGANLAQFLIRFRLILPDMTQVLHVCCQLVQQLCSLYVSQNPWIFLFFLKHTHLLYPTHLCCICVV